MFRMLQYHAMPLNCFFFSLKINESMMNIKMEIIISKNNNNYIITAFFLFII